MTKQLKKITAIYPIVEHSLICQLCGTVSHKHQSTDNLEIDNVRPPCSLCQSDAVCPKCGQQVNQGYVNWGIVYLPRRSGEQK